MPVDVLPTFTLVLDIWVVLLPSSLLVSGILHSQPQSAAYGQIDLSDGMLMRLSCGQGA